MKNLSFLSGVAVIALSILSVPAFAATDGGDVEISANVGFVSDYVFRGVSQSNEQIAMQGGFDVGHVSGLYAGVWGSNIDFSAADDASLELDLYAGYAGEMNGFSYDLGVIYYGYPGAKDSFNYDFVEGALALGYDFGAFAATASINYSPEFFGDAGHAEYYALGLDVPFSDDFGLSAHVGRQNIEQGTDYTDWSVGLGYAVKGFDVSLTYTDTNMDEPTECADGCAERVVFGVSKTF